MYSWLFFCCGLFYPYECHTHSQLIWFVGFFFYSCVFFFAILFANVFLLLCVPLISWHNILDNIISFAIFSNWIILNTGHVLFVSVYNFLAPSLFIFVLWWNIQLLFYSRENSLTVFSLRTLSINFCSQFFFFSVTHNSVEFIFALQRQYIGNCYKVDWFPWLKVLYLKCQNHGSKWKVLSKTIFYTLALK